MVAQLNLFWFHRKLLRGLELHPGEKHLGSLDRGCEAVEETQLV